MCSLVMSHISDIFIINCIFCFILFLLTGNIFVDHFSIPDICCTYIILLRCFCVEVKKWATLLPSFFTICYIFHIFFASYIFVVKMFFSDRWKMGHSPSFFFTKCYIFHIYFCLIYIFVVKMFLLLLHLPLSRTVCSPAGFHYSRDLENEKKNCREISKVFLK